MNRAYRHLHVLPLLVLVLALGVASPAFAASKYTRITGVKNCVSSSTASVGGTLQYKSGTWRNLAYKYVNIYRYSGGRWSLVKKLKTSSKGKFSASFATGYKYEAKFVGVTGYKSSNAAYATLSCPPLDSYMSAGLYSNHTLFGSGVAIPATATLGDATGAQQSMHFGGSAEPTISVTVYRVNNDNSLTSVITTLTDANGYWHAPALPIGNYRAVSQANPHYGYRIPDAGWSWEGWYYLPSCSKDFSVEVFHGVTNPVDDSVAGGNWNDAPNDTQWVADNSGDTSSTVYSALTFDANDIGGDAPTTVATTTLTIEQQNLDGVTYSPYTTVDTDANGMWSVSLPLGTYRVSYEGTSTFSYNGQNYYLDPSNHVFSVVAP